jgi:hypothetical protein
MEMEENEVKRVGDGLEGMKERAGARMTPGLMYLMTEDSSSGQREGDFRLQWCV